ncbi:hypothetical protein D3269_03900 [Listeria monocytogenes]|nr:hypothetical protein [Listeria monocytogenes]EAD2761108.1 hypothetical protein [Listeria monocytogenes]
MKCAGSFFIVILNVHILYINKGVIFKCTLLVRKPHKTTVLLAKSVKKVVKFIFLAIYVHILSIGLKR